MSTHRGVGRAIARVHDAGSFSSGVRLGTGLGGDGDSAKGLPFGDANEGTEALSEHSDAGEKRISGKRCPGICD